MSALPDISPEQAPRPAGGNRVRLLWPDPGLSPNARVHHMKLASLKKQAKSSAHWACNLWRVERVSAPALLTITFLPPDRRRRDLDNMLGSLKAALDGVRDYLGVDDSEFHYRISKGQPVKNGAVDITITAIAAD
ncbi:MAG: hypothetical protein M0R03_23125 [Novosphingobium sp.]|nr:hypothetical protein [Novosphingobium sp.]